MHGKNIFCGNIPLFLFFIFFSAFCLPPCAAHAVVRGDCVGCHSISGFEGTAPGEKPETRLQDLICVGCHFSPGGENTRIAGDTRVPVVRSGSAPVDFLSAGNYYFVEASGEDRGHNVAGISPPDSRFGGLPPGYLRETDPSLIGYNENKPLACAGSNGCHGDRNVEDPFDAIRGAHHGPDSPLDGSTVARSYRYLRLTGPGPGISGFEDPDWGAGRTAGRHNEYSVSMDRLCLSCHGKFFSGPDEHGRPPVWTMHPSGIPLPAWGEFLFYNMDETIRENSPEPVYSPTYSIDAPLARPGRPDGPSGEVTQGRDYVICLSCHFAHAGPFNHMLRWDYEKITTTGERREGCFICHPGKAFPVAPVRR